MLNNVPSLGTPAPSLQSTRAPINANFVAIDAGFSTNHVAFNTVGAGKHNFIQMPQQTIPAGTTGLTEVALFSAVGTLGPLSFPKTTQLFYQPPNSALPTPAYEITSSQPGAFGWTVLPSGMIEQWGIATLTILDGTSVFAFPFPFPTTCYNVQVTIDAIGTGNVNNTVEVFSKTAANFGARAFLAGNRSAPNVFFFAIGN